MSQILRGGTTACVYFVGAGDVLLANYCSQRKSVPFETHTHAHSQDTRVGAQTIASLTHETVHDDVIVILLTLVIKAGFMDSLKKKPLSSNVSFLYIHTRVLRQN